MKKSLKFAIGALVFIGLLAIGFLVFNNYAEKKIRASLETSLKKVNASFEKVDVKVLNRKAEIFQPEFRFKGKVLKVDTIEIDNIHLWDYLTKKNLIIGDLNISNPVIKIYNLPSDDQSDTIPKKPEKETEFKNEVLLKRVKISGGSFEIFEKDSSQHRLFTSLKKLRMENVHINARTVKESVPFDYELIRMYCDSLFYDLDDRHTMTASTFEMDNFDILTTDFRIIPKYSRAEHQKTIRVEKDRYNLKIDTIRLNNFNWNVDKDTMEITNSFTEIRGGDFRIYRDKLQPDDPSIKPMYSKTIRELPIKLGIDSVRVSHVYLRYEEKVRQGREPGLVEFSGLNGTIYHLSNIGMGRKAFPETHVIAHANLMKQAPVSMDLKFNIADKSDRFEVSGSMNDLQASQINNFLEPAMNVKAEGVIQSMNYYFAGNAYQAQGNMKVAYEDFKVEVLKKDGSEKNKIVSALANLIVKNKALSEKADYKSIEVQRDRSKSFWNYLWTCIKNGALKTFL